MQQSVNYFDAVVNFDISRVDDVRRDVEKTKRILRSYARSIGTRTKIASITEDVYPNETEDKENLTNKSITISTYLSALKKIFVTEDSLAWNPHLRSKTAIRTSGARYFTDPSIATAALGLDAKDLINDLQTMGLMFKTCV